MMHFSKTLLARASGKIPSVMPRIGQAYEGEGGFVVEDVDRTVEHQRATEHEYNRSAPKRNETSPTATTSAPVYHATPSDKKEETVKEQTADNKHLTQDIHVVQNNPIITNNETFIEKHVDQQIFENNKINEIKEIREVTEHKELLLVDTHEFTSVNKVFQKTNQRDISKPMVNTSNNWNTSNEVTPFKPFAQQVPLAPDNKRSSSNASTSQTIHVSIGRVEIKVTQQQEPVKSVQKKVSVMSLDEFLDKSDTRRG